MLLRWFGKEAQWWHPAAGREEAFPPSLLIDGSRQGAPPPFPLELLAPPPDGELGPEQEAALTRAEAVLSAESRVYNFCPSDGLSPSAAFVELTQVS